MANATRSNPGWVNAQTDDSWAQENAQFIDVFSGEVLTAFTETNVMKNLHLERTITEGKSATFPATWKANARYHVPGTPVLGSNQIKGNVRTIKIDDLLLADVFVYDLDEAKLHWDVRQIYSQELGYALAREYDKKTMQVATLAARASATVEGGFGGSTLTNANFGLDGAVLAAGIFSCAQTFDEKDVPEHDRNIIVKPAQYYLMAQTTDLLNKDWGGSGVYKDGTIFKVADINIVKSNRVPDSVVSGISGENNDYGGDFSNTVATCFQKQAIGTVKLKDLKVQKTGNDFNVMYQGDLIVGKYAMGHGILRPECAIELASA